jgi:CheY-like chemotaxis protein
MKKEILIIDFEPTILELLGFILSKDYNLILKPSCYDALLWLEHRASPDLILMDIEMPCFDGREFIKSLKVSGFYRNIPIVLLTHREESLLLLDIPSNSVEAYIRKPFNPIRLKEKIGVVLQNKNRKDELERFYN